MDDVVGAPARARRGHSSAWSASPTPQELGVAGASPAVPDPASGTLECRPRPKCSGSLAPRRSWLPDGARPSRCGSGTGVQRLALDRGAVARLDGAVVTRTTFTCRVSRTGREGRRASRCRACIARWCCRITTAIFVDGIPCTSAARTVVDLAARSTTRTSRRCGRECPAARAHVDCRSCERTTTQLRSTPARHVPSSSVPRPPSWQRGA